MGWGDWNVIAVITEAKFEAATQVAEEAHFPIRPIGRVETGDVEVVITSGGRRLAAPRLESERFAKDSWFATGIDGYIELLKNINVS